MQSTYALSSNSSSDGGECRKNQDKQSKNKERRAMIVKNNQNLKRKSNNFGYFVIILNI